MAYNIEPTNQLSSMSVEAMDGVPEPAQEAKPAPSAPPTAGATGALLETNPIVKSVFTGILPAVSAPVKTSDPIVDEVSRNWQALMGVGLDFYTSKDGKTGVLFNPEQVTADQIVKADDLGLLETVAPPYTQVVKTFGQQAKPLPRPSARPVTPLPDSAPMPGPAKVQGTLSKLRMDNLKPGAPSSGPAPGSGRLLNATMRRAT